jgi:hypothetical protein
LTSSPMRNPMARNSSNTSTRTRFGDAVRRGWRPMRRGSA